jgi:hypothetical protein
MFLMWLFFRFQYILETPQEQKFNVYRQLANLSHDFVNVARTYGELVRNKRKKEEWEEEKEEREKPRKH